MKQYILTYQIPSLRFQRGSNQKLQNLTAEEVKNWTIWLETRKINATYKITIK